MAKSSQKKPQNEAKSAEVDKDTTPVRKPKKYYKFKQTISDGNDTFEGGMTYCLPDELVEKYKNYIVEDDLSVTPPHTVRCGCKDKK